MTNFLRKFMLIFILVPAVGASAPILNIEDEAISLKADGTSFTNQEVRAAIIAGCVAKRWSPIVDDAGVIRATILVRKKYFVEVEITHTPEMYSITYVSTDKLRYNERRQTIHAKYNSWILNLRASINKKFHLNSTSATTISIASKPDTATQSNQQDVYSELLKLDDLREKGILTQAEFDAEKKKLLTSN